MWGGVSNFFGEKGGQIFLKNMGGIKKAKKSGWRWKTEKMGEKEMDNQKSCFWHLPLIKGTVLDNRYIH